MVQTGDQLSLLKEPRSRYVATLLGLNVLGRSVIVPSKVVPKLPGGVSVRTDGFTYSRTEAGQTKFTIHAKQSLGFKDDKYILLNDRYDVWQVAADGSGAKNLTDGVGRKEKLVFRVVPLRLDPQERGIDPALPLLLRVDIEPDD